MVETKRQKLTIKEVSEPKAIGEKGAQKLEFLCSDGKKWFTFSKALFPYIKTGIEIDANTEINEVERDGNTFINRQVKQIYVNGQPVDQAKQGYRYSGKSTEEIASIESQKFADITAQLWIAGKLKDDSEQVKALCDLLLIKLNKARGYDTQGPKKVAPKKAPTMATDVPIPDEEAWGKLDESPPESTTVSGAKRDAKTIKTITELYKACNEDFGMQPKDVLAELGISSQADITQIPAQCYIIISAVREEPK